MTKPKTMCIVNPTSGGGQPGAGLDLRLAERDDLITRVTCGSDDACRFGREAIQRGCEFVLVGGGDGTLNGVLQGIAPHFELVTLGVIPAGTGNDYARTLGIPIDPTKAVDIILAGQSHQVDIGRLSLSPSEPPRYFLNASGGGFSGQVGSSMTSQSKSFWGAFAYVSTAIGTIPAMQTYPATLIVDGEKVDRFDLLNIVVALGKTVGGGTAVAPWADPADGLFDVIAVPALSVTELAVEVPKLLTGNHQDSQRLIVRTGRHVTLSTEEDILITVDGELLPPQRLFDYSLLAQALRVLIPEPDGK